MVWDWTGCSNYHSLFVLPVLKCVVSANCGTVSYKKWYWLGVFSRDVMLLDNNLNIFWKKSIRAYNLKQRDTCNLVDSLSKKTIGACLSRNPQMLTYLLMFLLAADQRTKIKKNYFKGNLRSSQWIYTETVLAWTFNFSKVKWMKYA